MTPIRTSLIRHQTWLGGDRRVVGMSILLAILLGWMVANAYGFIFAISVVIIFWGGGVWIGQELVKNDPYTLDCWIRHLKYRKYYPAKAHHATEVPAVKDFT